MAIHITSHRALSSMEKQRIDSGDITTMRSKRLKNDHGRAKQYTGNTSNNDAIIGINDIYREAFEVTTRLVEEEMARMSMEISELEMFGQDSNTTNQLESLIQPENVTELLVQNALQPYAIGNQENSNLSHSQKVYKKSAIKENFPTTLHRLLNDLGSLEQSSDIAVYEPDGQTFHILDTKAFEREVMGLYFPRMKNFTSFRLQLKIYRFEEITSPLLKSEFAYSHPHFHRDNPASIALMQPGNENNNQRSTSACKVQKAQNFSSLLDSW